LRKVLPGTSDEAWKALLLSPHDYGINALNDPQTRGLMQKMQFSHGGPDYDAKYPDGIPTSVDIKLKSGKTFSSGLVMYPPGHARNTTANLKGLLEHKHKLLGGLVFKDTGVFEKFVTPLVNLKTLPAAQLQSIYEFDFSNMIDQPPIDGERPPIPARL